MINSYNILYLKGLKIRYEYSSNNQFEDFMLENYMEKIINI